MNMSEDSLIAWDLRSLDSVGSSILFLTLLFLLGFLSRKSSMGFLLAVCTTGLIIALVMLTHNNHGLPFYSFQF
jgi:uncharacterized membrane protein